MMAARGDASPVLRRRLDALAADVGRLRRHLDAESYAGFLAGRIAEGMDGLDALLGPTAAELTQAIVGFGVDVEEAVCCSGVDAYPDGVAGSRSTPTVEVVCYEARGQAYADARHKCESSNGRRSQFLEAVEVLQEDLEEASEQLRAARARYYRLAHRDSNAHFEALYQAGQVEQAQARAEARKARKARGRKLFSLVGRE